MANTTGVIVRGAPRLRRTLRAAGDDLSDLKAAHLGAATIAATAAQALAPRKTGRTAATVRPGATKTAAIIRAGRSSMPWVGRVHYGDPGTGRSGVRAALTRVRHRLAGGGHIQPHTYLIDGAHNTEPQWTAVYNAAVDKALQQVEGI